jgi:transposase InsO family protein
MAMLNWLGVKPSYSRPRVSDDNAYAESLFRTAKYRPEFPAKGFADLDTACIEAAPGVAASLLSVSSVMTFSVRCRKPAD